MTTPASGAISLGQIRTELEASGPISLGATRVRLLSDKGAGSLKLSDSYNCTYVRVTCAGSVVFDEAGNTMVGYHSNATYYPGGSPGFLWTAGGTLSKQSAKGVNMYRVDGRELTTNTGHRPLQLGFQTSKPSFSVANVGGTRYTVFTSTGTFTWDVSDGAGGPIPGFVVGNGVDLYLK